MNIEEAKSYLGYCFKEGAIDISDIEGKSDKELIEMAEEMMAKADYLADLAKEDETKSNSDKQD